MTQAPDHHAASHRAERPDRAPATMAAVVHDSYGEPHDVMRLEQVPVPEVGDDQVLVRVRAAGVDQGVWHLTAGLPYPVRLAGYGVRAPKRGTRGGDLAGVVEQVGRAVTAFRTGDEVYGFGEGTFAELALARPGKLARKPAGLTFEQAAATPVSGVTALQAVRRAGVRAGHEVLVLGASGGVGSFAVQIAKAAGAVVTGVASGAKLDLVRSVGADHAVDYATDDLSSANGRFDVVLDIAGNRSLGALRRLLTPHGTLVITGGEGGGRWLGGTDRQLRAMALSPFVSQRLGTFIAAETSTDLDALTALVEAGQVTPSVGRTYSLGEAATAIGDLRAGLVRGKAVIVL